MTKLGQVLVVIAFAFCVAACSTNFDGLKTPAANSRIPQSVTGCSDACVGGGTPRPTLPSQSPAPMMDVCPVVSTASGSTCGGASTPQPGPPGPLSYGGGPVEGTFEGSSAAPRVYIDFWGWQTFPDSESQYLTSFLQGVGGSSWFNTVTQYSVPGHYDRFGDLIQSTTIWNVPDLLQGSYESSTTAASLSITSSTSFSNFNTAVAAEARNALTHFNNANGVYVIALPPGHWDYSTVNACAYHQFVSANGADVPYIVIPYVSDAGALCGSNTGPGGALDGVSIVTGHELAEAFTDPAPYSGWADPSHNEVGDACAWQKLGQVALSTGNFEVQGLWSNATGSSDINVACVLSYP